MSAPFSPERPSEVLRSSSSYCFGAFAEIQAFASARNAASCGVSSKFIRVVLHTLSVVPANAGTHTHRPTQFNPDSRNVIQSKLLGVWVPAFAGTTAYADQAALRLRMRSIS